MLIEVQSLRSILLLVLALPVLAALVVAFSGVKARRVSLMFVLAHIALTALLVIPTAGFLSNPERRTDESPTFLPEVVPGATKSDQHATTWDLVRFTGSQTSENTTIGSVQLFLGLDGLNIWLVALSSVMMLPAVLASWGPVKEKANQFYAWMFLLQAAILGVFLSFDLLLFYVCFELTLIPSFFLIGVWGESSGRREAARKFFLYTLAGSLFTLVGLIGLLLVVYQQTGTFTFSIPELVSTLQQLRADENSLLLDAAPWLFVALALGFVVKIPLVPLHNWLPNAYGEAPIGVTILLSAVLAKMGTFAFVRVLLPNFPDTALSLGLPLFGTLAAVGIVYAGLCAYVQRDMKQMVAYSSISHLGFCALALLTMSGEGLTGGTLHMVNHGLATGALFLLVGHLTERYGTAQINEYGGLWNKLPGLTFFMFVIVLANIGVPALNNFISEMMMMAGVFRAPEYGFAFATAAAFGIFLSAWYLLTMVKTVFFGQLLEPRGYTPVTPAGEALTGRELAGLVPLTALIILLGCVPGPVIDTIKPDAEALSQLVDSDETR